MIQIVIMTFKLRKYSTVLLMFAYVGLSTGCGSTTTVSKNLIECLPEQRSIDDCSEAYEPVCSLVQVQCIQAPCNPVRMSARNACKACSNPLAIAYYE